jgi:MFS family permease
MAFAFRVLTGITCGLYSTICPTYLSEVAPDDKKFLFGFINQIGCAVGFLLVTVLGASVTWKQTSYICAVPSMILVLTSLFIPERSEAVSNSTLCDLFQYKKANFIAFLFMFFLQFSGVSAVLSNIETILTSANLTISSSLIGILTNVSQLVATIISAAIVDKLGNRLCWIIATICQLIAFIMLCLHQKLGLHSAVFMVSLFLEQIGYGIGTGPIPFAAAAELFNIEVRATGMAIGTGENWILAALVCLIWPYLKKGLTLGYAFLFFAGIQMLAIVFGLIVFKPKSEMLKIAAEVNYDNEVKSDTGL